jgi:tetratricopeptide (TPR) repeat protein
LEAQHRYDEAQQAFAAAHVADPHNWDATRSLFNAYSEELHQPEKAREVMEEMRRVAPDDPRIWLLEAASHKKGEEAQCRDALKKFLELTAGKPAGVAPWEIDRVRRRVAELDKLLGT